MEIYVQRERAKFNVNFNVLFLLVVVKEKNGSGLSGLLYVTLGCQMNFSTQRIN
jgi:hypothetical protein